MNKNWEFCKSKISISFIILRFCTDIWASGEILINIYDLIQFNEVKLLIFNHKFPILSFNCMKFLGLYPNSSSQIIPICLYRQFIGKNFFDIHNIQLKLNILGTKNLRSKKINAIYSMIHLIYYVIKQIDNFFSSLWKNRNLTFTKYFIKIK